MSDAAVVSRLRAAFRKALRTARRRRYQLCLELFAGEGHIAAAWRAMGYGALCVEISLGGEFDLTRPCVWKLVRGWISSHCIVCVWFGTPCTSWSRARRGPPGSRWAPTRSARFPLGLPGCSESDLGKFREGNETAKVTARLIRACLAARVPCGLENPQTSMLWQSPFLRRLVAHRCAQVLDVHLCQYGARWRKATKVVLWECVTCPDAARRCSGRRGVCSATGKPHVVLSGRDPSGGLWTRRAQAYPRQFARSFAIADASELLCIQNLTRFTHKI